MMAISAVPISDRSSPPRQAGVKCEQLPLPAVNASSTSAASAPYLATVVRFITHGRAAHADVVERARRRGWPPAATQRTCSGVELDEVAQVFGEDRGDGAQRRGPDDGELGPAEEKGRQRAEPLEDVGEHPARPRQRAGQLGIGEGAEQRHQPADHPGQQHRSRIVQPLGDAGRNPEDAAPDGRPHEHRDGTAKTEVSGEPLTPGIALGGHGLNIALTRLCRTRSFPAI